VPRIDAAAPSQRASRRPAPELPLEEAVLERDRARFLEEAVAHAAALRQRGLEAPPAWNRPTGNADVDALVWFRYVETEGLEPPSPVAPDGLGSRPSRS
jgi:hypothetical protein